MTGIPIELLLPLRRALLDCDEFHNAAQLRAILITSKLAIYKNRLPDADSPSDRVDQSIHYFASKKFVTGENALVLLLELLCRRIEEEGSEEDELHHRLLNLSRQLGQYFSSPSTSEAPGRLEANPSHAPMLHIADVEKMFRCSRSVARIDVLKSNNGRATDYCTGTAWLIAPGMAITCWHVIENRTEMESPLTQRDLEFQLANTVLRFDFIAYGTGIEYGIERLETPTLEQHELDYAILRLKDRSDYPLQSRGFLRLDTEMPLNAQSNLYIIQHPLGQDQQVSGDHFVKMSPRNPNHQILYKTPTEPGTSGSPVINCVNWRVVALHNAENEAENLREGTLMRSVLADIRQNRPELYSEIMSVQKDSIESSQ